MMEAVGPSTGGETVGGKFFVARPSRSATIWRVR